MRPGGPASVANAAASTTQVQGQINMYQDPYAHSAMATRTLLAMDNAADPWNAAANPAAVEEKATQMKAYYREEMDEKLAKQKAFDERKSAEKSAEKSARDEKRAGKKNAAPVAEGGAVLRGCRRWSLEYFLSKQSGVRRNDRAALALVQEADAQSPPAGGGGADPVALAAAATAGRSGGVPAARPSMRAYELEQSLA